MGKKKIYDDVNLKQKAYRARKKNKGYRGVLVQVPEHLLLFLKGEPSKLIEAFETLHKDLYIEFNQLAFTTKEGVPCAILRNIDNVEWKVTDPVQINILERFKRKAKLFVDGRLEVLQ